MSKPPGYALKTLEIITGAGYEARLVGGCVRDTLLSRRPSDWDAASSAPPEVVAALFPRTLPTGMRHGTVTVLWGRRGVEVTTFRREGGYSDHRRPDNVAFTGSLHQDLARRDFTINAMAMDADLAVTDLFGGRADLEAGLIRCVGAPDERFGEDALRMLRAFRFSAQLGFEIEPATLAAVGRCAPFCSSLSPERVRDELLKTLRSNRPDTVLSMLEAGLLEAFVLPGGSPIPRPTGLSGLPLYARWARLCTLLERHGYIMSTESFLTSLRLDGGSVRTASAAAALLKSGSRDWKRLLRDYGEAAVLAAYPRNRELRRVLRSGECRSLSALAVNGADLMALGFRGPQVGRALSALLDHVIDRPEDNRREILCQLAEEMRTENAKLG